MDTIKKHAILKWQYIYDNDGDISGLLNKYPELDDYIYGCSYCNIYTKIKNSICIKCPISFFDELKINTKHIPACNFYQHPYYNWYICSTKENARWMLRIVKDPKKIYKYIKHFEIEV